jgi:hypothetical protein
LPRRARALDDAASVAGALIVLRVRQDQALEHLFHIELGIVEQLLHGFLLGEAF